MINGFRDLLVWQRSIDLAMLIYSGTDSFPRSETFGLASQMRLAAISIPSNIAEGKALGGKGFIRHLRIALGSESELETQIELAKRLRLLAPPKAEELAAKTSEVGRMLAGLLRALPKD